MMISRDPHAGYGPSGEIETPKASVLTIHFRGPLTHIQVNGALQKSGLIDMARLSQRFQRRFLNEMNDPFPPLQKGLGVHRG